MWSLGMYIATFRMQTASILQAMRSTGYPSPYKARCSAMIGWFSTAVIGEFRSSLVRWFVSPGDRCRMALLLFCFLTVGIHASKNFYFTVPVNVVRVKSYVSRLFDLACVTNRITINKLYFIPKRVVSGVVGASSETVEVWVRANRMSRSCSLILSYILSSSLADVNFTAFTWNSVYHAILFSRVNCVFRPY